MTTSEGSDNFQFNRSIAQGSEQMAVTRSQLTFMRTAAPKAKLDGVYLQVAEDRPSLRLDDRYLGTWRTGSLHVAPMQVAVDSLLPVQAILETVIAGTAILQMSGLYPVLRAATESAALPIFLLDPDDRDERFRRSYLMVEEDAGYQDTFAASMGNPNSSLRERARSEIRERIAERPSLGNLLTFRSAGLKYSELMENADAIMAADLAIPTVTRMTLIAWWKLLPGLSHGR